MSDQIRDRINAALKQATKSQEKLRMSTLRLINAAIKDRDIAARTAGKREGVSDAEVLEILAKMIKQRRESVETYEGAGRLELAEREQGEIEVIVDFLPRQLDEAAMERACAEVVAEIGADGLKDMGRTMAVLKERYAGQMDFGKASGVVKRLLS
jgi:uncharacterized protein YqeY